MTARCCRILASRNAIPIPLPVQKPWSMSLNSITTPRRKFGIAVTVIHWTYTRPTPQKLQFPFGIRTKVFQEKLSTGQPSLNNIWTSSATFSQLVVSGAYYVVADSIQPHICYTRIIYGTLDRFNQSLLTAHYTSSSNCTESFTRKGSIFTVMFSSRGGTLWYKATRSTINLLILTQAGGIMQSVVSLYHTCIWVHAYFTRGGLEASRDNLVVPSVYALRLQSSCMISRIYHPRLRMCY